jgi:hypothetical protein
MMPVPVVSIDPIRLALILVAATFGGIVNAIAGGGTLITFPALVGLGIPAVVANATSTMALWPGASRRVGVPEPAHWNGDMGDAHRHPELARRARWCWATAHHSC